MSVKNIYGAGLKNVGSYQVAGKPFVTSSIVADGTEVHVGFPEVSDEITVKLNSAGAKSIGKIVASYPSASTTYNAAGPISSEHHGDQIILDSKTFTINFDGIDSTPGSPAANEIKTYERTGSAVYFQAVGKEEHTTAQAKEIGLYYNGDYSAVLSPTGSFSVSLWLNRKVAADPTFNYQSVFAWNRSVPDGDLEYALAIFISDSDFGTPNAVSVYSKRAGEGPDTCISNPNVFGEDKYHHLVVTCNAISASFDASIPGSGLNVYIDGALIKSGNSFAHLFDNEISDRIQIGDTPATFHPVTNRFAFNGGIQNFCMWSGVLSAADVVTLYNNASVKDPTEGSYAATLVDWWQIDGGDVPGTSDAATSYVASNATGRTLVGYDDFAAHTAVTHGVPFERHTPTEFYTAVTDAFNTTNNFGTFNVATPTANSSIIGITASFNGNNNSAITLTDNSTFEQDTNTHSGADGGELRLHYRSKDHGNVISNKQYWTLAAAGEDLTMNVKSKEIYLSANGGDCDFSLAAGLTDIPTASMYQHTGLGVDA